jgi:hypothetical protein
MRELCLICPRKQTYAVQLGMSAMGHERTCHLFIQRAESCALVRKKSEHTGPVLEKRGSGPA